MRADDDLDLQGYESANAKKIGIVEKIQKYFDEKDQNNQNQNESLEVILANRISLVSMMDMPRRLKRRRKRTPSGT